MSVSEANASFILKLCFVSKVEQTIEQLLPRYSKQIFEPWVKKATEGDPLNRFVLFLEHDEAPRDVLDQRQQLAEAEPGDFLRGPRRAPPKPIAKGSQPRLDPFFFFHIFFPRVVVDGRIPQLNGTNLGVRGVCKGETSLLIEITRWWWNHYLEQVRKIMSVNPGSCSTEEIERLYYWQCKEVSLKLNIYLYRVLSWKYKSLMSGHRLSYKNPLLGILSEKIKLHGKVIHRRF